MHYDIPIMHICRKVEHLSGGEVGRGLINSQLSEDPSQRLKFVGGREGRGGRGRPPVPLENQKNPQYQQSPPSPPANVYEDFCCFMHVGSKTCLEYFFLPKMCSLTSCLLFNVHICLKFHSSLLMDPPPRINIVRGNPSTVFADPSQVDC